MTNLSTSISVPCSPLRIGAVAIATAALGAVVLVASTTPPEVAPPAVASPPPEVATAKLTFREHSRAGRSTAPVALQASSGPAVIDRARSSAAVEISGPTATAPSGHSRSTAPISLW